jgi:radical SAM superfamily enzyme YgiQ (UPF0313 family)
VKKKICLIQPTYSNRDGQLFKCKSLYIYSLALPALSAAIPFDWEKDFCLECFEDVNYKTDASVIGISSMGYDIFHGYEIAEEFKKRGKIVLFGGPQIHFSQHRTESICDSVIYGHPGPKDMVRILGDIEAGKLVPKYHCGKEINFPFDYSVFDNKRILFMPVLTSIGCRNCCEFCCTAALYNSHYRLRRIEHVLADLQAISRRTRNAVFVDSNIYNNQEYLLHLCSRIVKDNIRFRWGAQCSIDIGENSEALHLLKQAGCKILFVGLESINQSNLDGFNKPYCVEKYPELIRRIRKSDIAVGGFFILGLDGDNRSTFDALFYFIQKTHISVPILNLLLPAPGTKIFDRLRAENRLLIQDEKGFISDNLLNKTACDRCFFIPKQLSVEEVETRFLEIGRKLSSLKEIFRRSFTADPLLSIALFYMNFNLRKDFRAMTMTRNEESFHRSPSSVFKATSQEGQRVNSLMLKPYLPTAKLM